MGRQRPEEMTDTLVAVDYFGSHAVPVTGIWLLRLGDHAIVRAEIDGKWVEVIREHVGGSFSHIVEPAGMRGHSTGRRAAGVRGRP